MVRDAEVLHRSKIAFYLETLTKENSALRFIPGPTRAEFSKRLARIRDQSDDPYAAVWGVSPDELPAHAVETMPGDVLAFKEDTYHSAWGGRPGRHQHAINFNQIPQMAQVRTAYERMTYSYHPVVQNLEHENPRLRALQQPMVDWGFKTQSV